MSIWLLVLVSLFALAKSQTTKNVAAAAVAVAVNQTDLEAALSDMRAKSYYGFVILLRILNTTSTKPFVRGDITFFMPNDEQLSEIAISPDHLEDFIMSHSIPTGLLLANLLHFPTGTMVPSGLATKMMSVTNNGRSGLFVNNARIVSPNVCLTSVMKCHGISTVIDYKDQTVTTPSTVPDLDPHRPPNQALRLDFSNKHYKRVTRSVGRMKKDMISRH